MNRVRGSFVGGGWGGIEAGSFPTGSESEIASLRMTGFG